MDRVPPIPSDPGLPGARGLLTGEGREAISAFLGERGWSVEDARPAQALYRPGRSAAVRYRVLAHRGGGQRTFVLCAETRARARTPGPLPEDAEDRTGLAEPVGRSGQHLVWAFPFDPSLPDLADVAWGPEVARRLGAAAVSVQLLRYRPRRRAVFRYRVLRRGRGGRRWETAFGKVLPRSKAERARLAAGSVLEGSEALRLSMPAGSLGEDAFVFEPARGRSLRDLLVAGGPLPSPERVALLPEKVAEQVGPRLPEVARPSPTEAAGSAAAVLGRLVPSWAAEVDRVVEAVAAGESRAARAAPAVHGDLYEAQVFVDEDFSLGLIDLDDLGPGDPATDAANFCAHLLVLALSVPAAADRLAAYRGLVREAFLRRLGIPSADLAWREALAALLLASGPFRVLDPRWPAEVGRRVQLAVRLLEQA
ncbi:MAG: phosphotransferase family protein [Actinomycetota bacterium]